ncbi:sortase [[Clostridium] innocuum]|nr:sortase [[Clostridium] innocuum]
MKKKLILGGLVTLLTISLIPFVNLFFKEHEKKEIENNVKETVKAKKEKTQGSDTLNFAELKQMNSDLVAIMYIPDTDIYFPIVQTTNNEYYLKHNFYKNYDEQGSIYMDANAASDFSGRNTFIYGHSVLGTGGMFTFLKNYMSSGYYQQHPIIKIMTEDKLYDAHIVSAYKDVDTSASYQTNITDDVSYSSYIDMIVGKSNYATNVQATTDENMITLYTCSLDGITNASQLPYTKDRYFIHAVLQER